MTLSGVTPCILYKTRIEAEFTLDKGCSFLRQILGRRSKGRKENASVGKRYLRGVIKCIGYIALIMKELAMN
jgi:hypothetical protein